MPDIQPNWLAIGLAVLINFFFSYVWYTPIFGKLWALEMGRGADDNAQGTELVKGLLTTALSCFLIAWVLSNNIAAWSPKTWGSSIPPLPAMVQAVQAAFFTWLGYFVPVLLARVAWERKSWTLFAINAGYYFLVLLITAGVILLMP